jgi:CRP-like cAMP-binding protein
MVRPLRSAAKIPEVIPMRRIACEGCTVRARTCFADVPADDLGEFQACRVPGLYKPRQIVFHEGTPATGLYIVCHGAVKLYRSDRFGRDFIIAVATPGSIIGELGVDDRDCYSTSAEALTECQVSFLPRERLVRYLERHPKTGVGLVAALSQELAATRRKAGELALKRADARLAELLLRLSEDARATAGAEPPRFRLDYSRRELAEMIGVSTETAIRLLAKLKRLRMIATAEDEVVIADVERLTRLAHHGDLAA